MKFKTIITIVITFIIVFLIYLLTMDKKIYYLNLGDNLNFYTNFGYSNELSNYLDKKNKLERKVEFIDIAYRITDLINDIEYNKYLIIDNEKKTLKNALIKADLITLSIGKNDLYYKLSNSDIDEIYNYTDEMLVDLKKLLKLIRTYCKEEIIFIGIIDYETNYPEVIEYLNDKIKNICNNLNIKFIDINSKISKNNEKTLNGHNNQILINEIKNIINKTL